MRGPDGIVYPMTGVYQEIVEPERLVFTSAALDDEGKPLFEVLNTVAFAEQGGRTTLTTRARVVKTTAAAPRISTGWKRVAKEADGWFPVGIPLAGVARMFAEIRGMAREADRDPTGLAMIVRANVEISDAPLGQERADFTGTLEQIPGDVAATRTLGAAERLLDAQFSPGVETARDIVARMEQLWKIANRG
jgi:alkanesulfonate monooxygenase SsuD/methylene tetrahydromethanopterin reductase-like flavin-dependent oxidoreductase (luciferase family)